MSKLDALLELAFLSGPGEHANQLIEDARQRVAGEVGRAVNYEVSLIGRQWDHLEQVVAPRLAFYLRSKCYDVGHCAPVFLTIFVDQTVYFVRAGDFYEHLRCAKGLDRGSFAQMTDGWEQTGRAALAALPSAASDE